MFQGIVITVCIVLDVILLFGMAWADGQAEQKERDRQKELEDEI